MKKILCVLLALLCITLTACQPTPDNEVVVNKGDKKAENAVLNSSTEEIVPLVCPERWTEAVEIHDAMSLIIDAPVEVGEGDKHPVYTIQRRSMDAQFALNVVTAMFPDAESLRVEALSYDELLEDLQVAERGYLEEYDEEGNPVYVPYDGQEEQIASLKEQLAQTNPESTYVELTAENFTPVDGSCVVKRKDGSLVYLFCVNETASFFWCHMGRLCNIQKENWVMQLQEEEGKPVEELTVAISQEEAVKMAEEVLSRMGISNVSLSNAIRAQCMETRDTSSNGWHLEYGIVTEGTRGCSIRYYSQNGVFAVTEDAYSMPWDPTSIEIYVTENGVQSLSYNNLYDIVSVANEDVQLLSFEEIQERVRTLFRQGLMWTKGRNTGNSEVYITKIILTTGIMQLADNLEEALLVPAWAIFYTTDGDMKDYIDQSLLLLNALDGSIMN